MEYIKNFLTNILINTPEYKKEKALSIQKKILKNLLKNGKKTIYGKKYSFEKINNAQEYNSTIPITTYEDLAPYIQKIKSGENSVLWPGLPIYFAKTSGTTAREKLIPVTSNSLKFQILSARDALFWYALKKNKVNLIWKKVLFLSGSPALEKFNKIKIGRLSGIVNHHVPFFLKKNHLPSYTTNCEPDWECKLEKIFHEMDPKKLSLVSGIPPWIQMFFETCLVLGKKNNIKELFPNLEVIIHGGVNFNPYKEKLEKTIGKKVDFIETFPASEGFFALQNDLEKNDLLLQINSDIYYEFIELKDFFEKKYKKIPLEDVKLNINYALIITTSAGLWSYAIGDTVKFTSLSPYKILVTGRTSQYISAFGEHVIAEEIENALAFAMKKDPNAEIEEFTVAPKFYSEINKKPHYEWYIEFKKMPYDFEQFEKNLDKDLKIKNIYYKDLIQNNILARAKIVNVSNEGFYHYLKCNGKIGEQNKVTHLSNNRKIVDEIDIYNLRSLSI